MQEFLKSLAGEPITLERTGKEPIVGTVRSVRDDCVILEAKEMEWAVRHGEIAAVSHMMRETERKEEKTVPEKEEKSGLVMPMLSRQTRTGMTIF